MGLFKKKPDPISDRARVLHDQIAALEAQIKALNTAQAQIQSQPVAASPQPRLRSTTLPHGPTLTMASTAGARALEPIFEEINSHPFQTPPEKPALERHPDLGANPSPWGSVWQRFKRHFRSPVASNPKLVNYLAAGSIQGLRPLRYEKRVARNRFVVLMVFLILLVLGVISYLVKR
jgi:hypothetical protein